MLKNEISEGLVQYIFEPLPGRHFGNNIFALIDCDRVLLIDTAYEEQAEQVLKEIRESGMGIDGIIISHFHDDHMYGMKALPKVPTYGSEYYKTTLEMWTDKEDRKYFKPTIRIKNETYSFKFGKHNIDLIPFPGHSLCTILTRIDETYLHVADELMFSMDGEPILPSADPNCIQRHVDSLNRLKALNSYIFLPGHGVEVEGSEKIEKEIDNRIAYFTAILNSSRKLTYEEAKQDCSCDFLHSEWHRYVYE